MHIKGHAIRSTTAPSRPVTPTVTNVSDTSLTFSWTANTESHVVSYNIMRSTDGTSYSILVTDWPTASYTDTNLTSGQIYYYRVASKSSNGQVSEFSFATFQETTATGQLSWTATPIPTVEFNYGVPDTFDLDPYITGIPTSITVETGSLPPNVTVVGQTLSYDGGGSSSGNQQTGISLTLVPDSTLDWQTRISGSEVVWYHNFDSNAEVTQFLWNGSGYDADDSYDPGETVRAVGEGVHGGDALRVRYKASTESRLPGRPYQSSAWARPFSPLTGATNGKGTDDPGASGQITRRTWDPDSLGGTPASWQYGFYGHSTYADSFFDGQTFYLQYRLKISASRYSSGNPSAGKTLYLDATNNGYSNNQEIVIQNNWSYGPYAWWGSYTNFGQQLQGPGGSIQVGSQWPLCGTNSDPGMPNGCFFMVPDQWYTFLYRLSLGRQSTPETIWQAWVVRPGETSYTLIHDYSQHSFNFSAGRKGHNAVHASCYMNDQTAAVAWYQWYDEFIFSRSTIPAPSIAV